MITIIIPVFNNLTYTQQCIDSIYKYTDPKIFNLLLIDNNSTDGTTEYFQNLQNIETNFSFIRNEQNLGYARANNQGVLSSQSEKVLFLNNDTVVTENWLEVLEKELDNNQDIKITGSKLLYEDNTIQHAGIVFSGFKTDNCNIIYHLYRFFPGEHPAVNKKRHFQALTGACILTERDFFIKIGGFNENYKNGFEDIDLCLKAKQYGGGCLYCPESTVYHFEAKTKGRFDKTRENTELFYSTWRELIVPDDYLYYEKDGFFLNKVSNEWKIIDKQIQNDIVTIKKQEVLNIIFEKKFSNIDFCLFLKSENGSGENKEQKEYLLKLQVNTKGNFKLFLIGNPESTYLLTEFKNINLIVPSAFNFALLEKFIEQKSGNKIIFLADSENINYGWNEKYIAFNSDYVLEKIQQFNNGIVDKNDLSLLENLNKVISAELDLPVLLAEAYQINGKYSEAISILSNLLKTGPKDQKILKIMINCLRALGDDPTADKLTKLL